MDAADNQKHDTGPWDTLLLDAGLATMCDPRGYGIIEHGAIGMKDGKIAWVGPVDSLPLPPERHAAEVIDAGGIWITPGLIDCHTHLVYGGNRAQEFAQRIEGKSYEEIAREGGGIQSTVRATRAADEEELQRSAANRLLTMVQQGVTTVEIKSGYGLDTANEIKMLKVARSLEGALPVSVRTTFLGAHSVAPEYAGKADAYIDHICKEMLPAIVKEGLADAVDAYCESVGFTPQQVAKLFDAAKKHNLPVKLHAEQLSDTGGAALAARYKALSAEHLEYASEKGVKAMGEAGTVAVLLPGAFYSLRETQKPPVAWFRRYGVPMALATDCNPGTSPASSLLLMMNMGCVLFGMTPEEALLGVTRNAALALGIFDKAGVLEIGRDADLALWDIEHPVELSYHLGYNPCIGIVKDGVMRNVRL